jgi:hypothetical protein
MVRAVVEDWLEPSVRLWPHPDRGPWSVTIMWRAHAGRPVCSGVHLDLLETADVEPVTALLVRQLPIARLIREARRERFLATGGGLFDAEPDDQVGAIGRRLSAEEKSRHAWSEDAPKRRRAALDEDHYRQVAHVYSRAASAGLPPTLAVMHTMFVSRPTASRWVAEARARRLIPPAAGNARRDAESRPGRSNGSKKITGGSR